MELNIDLLIIVLGIIIICIIFREPLSKLIIKISEFRFKKKNKDKETSIEIIAKNQDEKEEYSVNK